MSHWMYDQQLLVPLAARDEALEALLTKLEDVPMNPETEKIEEPFLHWPVGTDRLDIWRWFDARYSKGVAHLLYRDGVDRTMELANLTFRMQMCSECDAENCAFNPEGICGYPLLYGKDPGQSFDGCEGFAYVDRERQE